MADDDPTPVSLDQAVTTVPAAPSPAPPAGGAGTVNPEVTTFELDRTRKQLAYRLLWIMIGIIGVIMLMSTIYSVRCWIDGGSCAAATTALGILTGSLSPIFTAMVGLVGSVVGFYFGSKSTG